MFKHLYSREIFKNISGTRLEKLDNFSGFFRMSAKLKVGFHFIIFQKGENYRVISYIILKGTSEISNP